MLFIIFGTRGITYTKEQGTFHCPGCSQEREYRRRRVRRFFTLYFIPVVPLNLAGEYVECSTCRSTYQPEVLDYDPAAANQAFEAEYQRAVRRVMVEIMAADGEIDQEEIRVIGDLYQRLTDRQLGEDQIRAAVVDAEAEGLELEETLRRLAPMLNDQGKEMVVQAALLVAAADGHLHEEESRLVGSVGSALGMSEAHFNGVLQSMNAPSR